ncbi:MAG TPA: hypothetical protein VF406_07840 [Thermodesulfobacteriota bacterium]
METALGRTGRIDRLVDNAGVAGMARPKEGNPDMAAYAAAGAGVPGFTRALGAVFDISGGRATC